MGESQWSLTKIRRFPIEGYYIEMKWQLWDEWWWMNRDLNSCYERRACISLKFIDKDLILSKILIIPTGKRRMFWNIICVLDCSFIIRWDSTERLQNTHLFVKSYFIHSFTTCMKDLKILLKDPVRSFITVYCFTHANSFLNYFNTPKNNVGISMMVLLRWNKIRGWRRHSGSMYSRGVEY